jgi:hypothetical protein
MLAPIQRFDLFQVENQIGGEHRCANLSVK